MKKLISVVVPTYNEEENVDAMTETLTKIFTEELPQYDYEIIYIDNHSKDGTRRLLRKQCARRCTGLSRPTATAWSGSTRISRIRRQ